MPGQVASLVAADLGVAEIMGLRVLVGGFTGLVVLNQDGKEFD